MEMVEATENFGKSLSLIETYYREPLQKLGLANESVDRNLFAGIDVVRGLNNKMTESLHEIKKDWKPEISNVGMMLIEIAPYIRLYRQYMLLYPKASWQLKALGSEAFEKFLETQNELLKKKYPGRSLTSLSILLTQPIKRVSSIVLLMKELLKRTPTCHTDFGPLKKAVDIWKKISSVIDKAAGKHGRGVELLKIQSRLDPPRDLISLRGSSSYIMNGVVRTYIHRGKESKRKDYGWYLGLLFSHVFVLCSSPDGLNPETGEITDDTASLRIVYITSLRRCFKSALNEDVPREVMKRTADHTIQIYGTPSSFNLEVKSWRQKRRWLKAFKQVEAKKSYIFNLPFAPVWLPPFSPQADSCGICGKKLGSLFRSRHHCRECGNCVCNNCSKSRELVHGVSRSFREMLRVCDACVQDKEIHGETEMIECLEESGSMSAMLQQPPMPRLDLCKGQSRSNHQVDRFGYAKRCLGLVKGVCPYLDEPAIVKEVIGDLSSTPFRVLRTQCHVPGKLDIKWLSKTPGYLFIAVPASRPPTWLGSRCVSTSNKIKLSRSELSRSDTDNDDTENDEIMTLWRLRRVCSKKEVVSIPAADVKDGSFDSVESWNYFVLATFQNRYPLYVVFERDVFEREARQFQSYSSNTTNIIVSLTSSNTGTRTDVS